LKSSVSDIASITDEVLSRCDTLAACSEEPDRLTRTFLSAPTRRVHELLRDWMQQAGLAVRVDALGNMIGRRPGLGPRVFAIGSHIDTVPNAGKYDGVLGVLLGLAAMDNLRRRTFQRTVDVIAFSEEEGMRFCTPYLGSRAVCGRFDPGHLALKDSTGVTMADALRRFGLDPGAIDGAAYPPGQPCGYIEAHIEQGPVLDAIDLPLGVVTGIVGQSRYWLQFKGRAGHAGAQPMHLRRDALAAAAEFVTMVEQAARQTEGLRATVGSMTVSPGAINVVPGEVRLSLDVRHENDEIRRQAAAALLSVARVSGLTRQVAVPVEQSLEDAAVACDTAMTERLADAVSATEFRPYRLPSGAGHDAAVMASRCPVAMLFLRSPGGVSHHPDEAVHRNDVVAALTAMTRFLEVELDLE
jgi:allantoate deiminase